MEETIFKAFVVIGIRGFTRAELAQFILHSNEQHRICAQVKTLVESGILLELPVRRPHPTNGRSGKVLVLKQLVEFYNEIEGN